MEPAQTDGSQTPLVSTPDVATGPIVTQTAASPDGTPTQGGIRGAFSRAAGLFGGEPLAAGPTQAPDQTPVITAQSGIDASTIAAVPPPVEATWQTDSGQVPGLQPRGYEPAAAAVSEEPIAPATPNDSSPDSGPPPGFQPAGGPDFSTGAPSTLSPDLTPTPTPVSSVEPIAAWAAPTEPGKPVVADSSTGTPDATPPVSPVWPTTPDAAASAQIVSDPIPAAEADISSASSPSVEPVDNTPMPEVNKGPLSPEELAQYRTLNERLLDQLASEAAIAKAN